MSDDVIQSIEDEVDAQNKIDAQIISLASRGYGCVNTAHELGIDPQTVSTRRRFLGVTPTRRNWRHVNFTEQSAALGWPSLRGALALVLNALERIGVGNSQQVTEECMAICDERDWYKWQCGCRCTAASLLRELENLAYVVSRRKGNHKVWRLRPGIKEMPDAEREAIAKRFRDAWRELKATEKLCRKLMEAANVASR